MRRFQGSRAACNPRALCLLFGALLSSCDILSPSAPAPATVAISRSLIELDAVGATVSLSAEVRDRDGTVMPAVPVTWSSSHSSVATVSPEGVVTATGNGMATITATAGTASGSATVSVSQAAAALAMLSGANQTGAAGEPLPVPLVVQVHDRLGLAVIGAPVTFQIQEGGGQAAPAQIMTDSEGRATATWTLGTRAGEAQTVRSFLSHRVGVGVSFGATAVAGPAAETRKISGDQQAGPRLSPLFEPLAVRVEDRFGNPIAGMSVAFIVTEGAGSVEPSHIPTDTSGHASARWTLGAALGAQTVSVSAGAVAPATFTAIASTVPSRAEVLAGDGQVGTVAALLPQPPSVRVLDETDAPVASVDVRFSVSAAGGLLQPPGAQATSSTVTVRSGSDGVAALGGWTLGTTPGTHTLTVEIPQLDPIRITATANPGPPALLIKISGDGQTAIAGTDLNSPIGVQVTDFLGNPVPAVKVRFEPTAGSGSVSPSESTSDENGNAFTSWRLGPSAGLQHVNVTTESGLTVPFQARATNPAGEGFSIELRFLTESTPGQRQAFEIARARWEEVIAGKLEPVPVQLPAGFCGLGSPALDEVVDDLLIFVRLEFIDGVGGTLGQAGPCSTRAGDGLPVVGRLTLDSADLDRLEAGGRLVDLVVHEIAHVLGFGSLWSSRGLLRNPSTDSQILDTHFSGANAIAAFDAVGGTAYTAGSKVAVENQGGAGTRNSHWRKSVFGNELMTGFLDPGANPLSRVTAASLVDLGYPVDLSRVDQYSLNIVAAAEAGLPLGDDVYRGRIYVLDRQGRIRQVIDR